MLKSLDVIGRFLRSVVAFVVVAFAGVAGWFGYDKYYGTQDRLEQSERDLKASRTAVDELGKQVTTQKQEIGDLNLRVEKKQQEIDRLNTAVRLLTIDQRVARLEVVKQTGSAVKGDLVTQFSFAEIDDKGQPLESPRTFSIKGDIVYLDAWVVKYNDKLIEAAEPDHDFSICLFRRLFGEAQQPKDGFVIDTVGASPAPYRSGKPMTEAEREVWARFWDYANNPRKAETKGIRAAHGEAPSIKLLPGMKYRVVLRASGGLSIIPEEITVGAKTSPT